MGRGLGGGKPSGGGGAPCRAGLVCSPGGSDSAGPSLARPRPRPARRHLRALDDFARENIYSLYGFNFTESEEDPGAEALGSEPAFQLDRGIRLQRLSPLGGQNRVGFRLVSVSAAEGPGGTWQAPPPHGPRHPPSVTAPAATACTEPTPPA